jgi:hypothetical protein
MVYQINTSGVSVVSGSPFLPSPIPMDFTGTIAVPSPTLTALDPAGQYLYALYNGSYYVGEVIYTYKMVNGVPNQVSISGYIDGADDPGSISIMFATAQHLYAFETCYHYIPCGSIWNTTNGVIANSGFGFQVPSELIGTYSVTNITVDPQEKFLYMYLSSTGGTVSDTIAIYSLNFATSTSTLVQVIAQSGQVLLGAK